MERITISVSWDAEDGSLKTLEDEGGDVTLVATALEIAQSSRDGCLFLNAVVKSTSETMEEAA